MWDYEVLSSAMMRHLDLDNLTNYLVENGLIEAVEIVNAEMTLEEVSRRNANFRVKRDGRRGYLVKQAYDGVEAKRTLAIEADFYNFVHGYSNGEPIRRVIPSLVRYDPDNALLVLELINGAQPLSMFVRNRESPPAGTAASLGRLLSLLHTCLAVRDLHDHPALAAFQRFPPWVLWLHKPSTETLVTMTLGSVELLRIIREHSEIGRSLEDLRSSWKCEAIVHGDVKSDNILTLSAAVADRVVLVDWELAHFGDPAWDIGSAFADWIREWVISIPSQRDSDLAEMMKDAAFPLTRMQGLAREFWWTYARDAEISGSSAENILLRAVRFCAARLVQAAYEIAGCEPFLPRNAAFLLQVGMNVFAGPDAALEQLLGLYDSHGAKDEHTSR